jgi:hypothetical protein
VVFGGHASAARWGWAVLPWVGRGLWGCACLWLYRAASGVAGAGPWLLGASFVVGCLGVQWDGPIGQWLSWRRDGLRTGGLGGQRSRRHGGLAWALVGGLGALGLSGVWISLRMVPETFLGATPVASRLLGRLAALVAATTAAAVAINRKSPRGPRRQLQRALAWVPLGLVALHGAWAPTVRSPWSVAAAWVQQHPVAAAAVPSDEGFASLEVLAQSGDPAAGPAWVAGAAAAGAGLERLRLACRRFRVAQKDFSTAPAWPPAWQESVELGQEICRGLQAWPELGAAHLLPTAAPAQAEALGARTALQRRLAGDLLLEAGDVEGALWQWEQAGGQPTEGLQAALQARQLPLPAWLRRRAATPPFHPAARPFVGDREAQGAGLRPHVYFDGFSQRLVRTSARPEQGPLSLHNAAPAGARVKNFAALGAP